MPIWGHDGRANSLWSRQKLSKCFLKDEKIDPNKCPQAARPLHSSKQSLILLQPDLRALCPLPSLNSWSLSIFSVPEFSPKGSQERLKVLWMPFTWVFSLWWLHQPEGWANSQDSYHSRDVMVPWACGLGVLQHAGQLSVGTGGEKELSCVGSCAIMPLVRTLNARVLSIQTPSSGLWEDWHQSRRTVDMIFR